MAAARTIDFYFDFSSPYSYIASEWIEALAARHGRTVSWRAILIGASFQVSGLKPQVEFPLKREYALLDFARSARFAGVPFTLPPKFPIATPNVARVFWCLHDEAGPDRARDWAHHALRAYFTRGVDLSDAAALDALAVAFGLEAGRAEAIYSDPRWKLRLKSANEAAIAHGVFGVPYMVVEGEPFWGNDRRAQLERWLEKGPF
jgi:2-hydroxychromene-2-carboxylate isomerase